MAFSRLLCTTTGTLFQLSNDHFLPNSFLYSFFWVIPRCLNFMCRRFGARCLFQLRRPFNHLSFFFLLTPPMKMEQSVPKRRHIKFRRRGITQKKNTKFGTRRNFEIKISLSIHLPLIT